MTVRRRLLPALARYRLRLAVLLALTATVFAGAYAAVVTISAGSRTAMLQSVWAEHGGYPYSIQVVNQADGLSAVRRQEGLQPVQDTAGVLTADGGRVPVDVRVTRQAGVPLGVLVDGRRPGSAKEITISRAVARDAAVGIGTKVQLATGEAEETSKTVVGLTTDPADAADATVVSLDPGLSPEQSTVWLDGKDAFERPGLQEVLLRRSVTARTTELLAEERAAGSGIFDVRFVAPALTVLLLAVLTSLAVALRPVAQGDVAALRAAGMSKGAAWRLMFVLFGVSVLIGVGLGFVITALAVTAARATVSGWLGQDWQHVTFPVGAFTLLLLVIVTYMGAVAATVSAAGRLSRSRTSLRWIGPALSRASRLFIAAGVILYALTVARVLPVGASTVAGALIVLGMPAAALRLMGRGQLSARAKVIHHLAGRLLVLTTAVSLTAWSTGFYASREVHNAAVSDRLSMPYQPAGSMLVLEVPKRRADLLVAGYPGREVRTFDLPDESSTQVRVTSPSVVNCMARDRKLDANNLEPACYPVRTSAPINRVMLLSVQDDSTERNEVLADAGLIGGGTVGLLRFATGTATVTELAETKAAADTQLGGNMPGLVLPADSPQAEALGLRPSGGQLVAFLDFSSLPPRDRARFRAMVAKIAPAAQVAEDGYSFNDVARSVARAVAILGLALTSVLLMIGGLAIIAAARRTRRLLVDMGATSVQLRALALRWSLLPVSGLIVAAMAARLSAWISGVHDGPSAFGWGWLTPAVGGLIVCAFLALQFARVPERVGE